MTMKERVDVHRQIEAENERKLKLWMRYMNAERILGFMPASESELLMYESNGYDDGILAYR